MKKKMLKFIPCVSSLILITAQAQNSDPHLKKDLDASEMFPSPGCHLPPLQGKIIRGRYFSPKNLFSCAATEHIAQDGMMEGQCVMVGFYNLKGNFKKAEIFIIPGMENKKLGKEDFLDIFKRFGIETLENVDNAQGIETLKEEFLEEKNLFFVTISIKRMSVLKAFNGVYMASTRGYAIFQEKDKIVVLSNQIATQPGQRHTPKNHIATLKQDILDFKDTFEFDCANPIDDKLDLDGLSDMIEKLRKEYKFYDGKDN